MNFTKQTKYVTIYIRKQLIIRLMMMQISFLRILREQFHPRMKLLFSFAAKYSLFFCTASESGLNTPAISLYIFARSS